MAPRATPSTRCPTQPFAALLLNGFKTLETRNNELFAPYEGRRVVVRVGMKDWDNASWKLWHPAGAADLRPGFRRGDAAGVVDVGETRRLASFEDAAPRACACVEDCGAFGTVISNAKWFPKPWRVRGFPGVVDLAVPADLVGGAAAAATARAARSPAIDAVAAPAKKTGNRRQRRARLQSGPGAAACKLSSDMMFDKRPPGNTTSNKVPYPEHDTHASTWPPRPSSIVVGAAAAAAPGAVASSVNWIASAAGRVLK